MILLCGIPSEPPMARVLDRLTQSPAAMVFLNQREFENWSIDWSVEGGHIEGELVLEGRRIDLDQISSIFIRLMDDRLLPELENDPADSPRRARCRALHEALVTWTDIAPARVVNRFRSMGSNASKPFQAQLIQRLGFLTPETLVTNDENQIQQFRDRHGRLIYKSISGYRSVVQELSEADLARIETIRACPVQFQAYVPGFDLRVHTIGDVAFGTRVDSQETDYRYADHGNGGTNLIAYELDDNLSERCVRLAAGLGLEFAGIDLRITPDGSVYCFEVNPSPAYSYYEAHTDQPISAALAHYLAEPSA